MVSAVENKCVGQAGKSTINLKISLQKSHHSRAKIKSFPLLRQTNLFTETVCTENQTFYTSKYFHSESYNIEQDITS